MFRRASTDETLILATALRALAAEPVRESAPPDPSFIWWKAQLLRRREAERQATAPIEVGDRVHLGAAIVGALALAAGVWDRLPSFAVSPATAGAVAASLVILLSIVAVAAIQSLHER